MIVYDKERLGDWAIERIDAMKHVKSWGDFEAVGWEKNGELQAVVVFNYFSGCDIAMHIAAVPGKRWMTREFLSACFRYPFIQLGCRRVSGYVPSKLTHVIEFDKHLGFEYEGTLRHALPDDDLILLGMLRENCRYVELRKAA